MLVLGMDCAGKELCPSFAELSQETPEEAISKP